MNIRAAEYRGILCEIQQCLLLLVVLRILPLFEKYHLVREHLFRLERHWGDACQIRKGGQQIERRQEVAAPKVSRSSRADIPPIL